MYFVFVTFWDNLYWRRKVTGRVNLTRTGLPCCLPGLHLGMDDTTRNASLSSDGSTERVTRGSTIEPSRLTMKETSMRPCMPVSCAAEGYLRFLANHVMRAAFPPGNDGSSSTNSKISSSPVSSNVGAGGAIIEGPCGDDGPEMAELMSSTVSIFESSISVSLSTISRISAT